MVLVLIYKMRKTNSYLILLADQCGICCKLKQDMILLKINKKIDLLAMLSLLLKF